ncbi:hypothetical protein OEB99_01680 [Actinotalea sp. M2MS4P-6]|uniref:hypothetical protein n=1 Tax=Actinotalea sp. M2MS4P-6 TaxID=2983762 RepID=UPI0021E37374|nr:hypothetical protein [Actinotalea sp. M2MS4P-6]MCV2393007.1 hypothetical protein [Actinotalea sp. M2MS4P-6]
MTSLPRTVVDCLMSVDPRSGLILADAALRRGLERDEAALLLSRMGGRRGIRKAREVLDHADAGAESPGESSARHAVLAAGLPRPLTQMRIDTDTGPVWSDLGWEQWRIAVEYDGIAKYGAGEAVRDALLAERRRERAIQRAGVHVIRVTAAELREPGRLVADVLTLAPPAAAYALTPRPHLLLT